MTKHQKRRGKRKKTASVTTPSRHPHWLASHRCYGGGSCCNWPSEDDLEQAAHLHSKPTRAVTWEGKTPDCCVYSLPKAHGSHAHSARVNFASIRVGFAAESLRLLHTTRLLRRRFPGLLIRASRSTLPRLPPVLADDFAIMPVLASRLHIRTWVGGGGDKENKKCHGGLDSHHTFG